ncbi:hypothetical protein AMAG_03900 [Allomyces macrogynus ATCC 38327]|uniref:Uncharacterized protein n=1 Tax=Allomyces macrogynus (strain ATCC 38327) TaxID=578462 RepID=A0A0L0SAN8_ALLM3|nr:hypothetical protein AMAG_03900 [Allomyces macrogynus ATCC 38327]|eukprot:KNE59648.1 hypothetical protein AMAG_03900 [Allomyces macrogynus ATCC 38327]
MAGTPTLCTGGTSLNRSSNTTGSSSTSTAMSTLRSAPLISRGMNTPPALAMLSADPSQNDAFGAMSGRARPRLALFLLDKNLPDVWTYATKEHPGLTPPKDVTHVVFMTETSRPSSMDLTRSRYTVRGPEGVYWPGLDAQHVVHSSVDDTLHAILHPEPEDTSQLVVVGTRNQDEVLEAAFHLARGLEPSQVALVCWPRDVNWSLDEWADRRGLFGNTSPRYKQFSTANLIAHWEQTLDRDQRQNLHAAVSYVTKILDKQPNGVPLTADAFHALLPTPWTVPIDRNLQSHSPLPSAFR